MKRINKWLLRWLRACINALEKSVRVDTQSKIKTPIVDKGVNLLILRDTFTDESTIGELFINGERFCDTLELPYRDNQRSISCIPTGSYKLIFVPPKFMISFISKSIAKVEL